MPPLSMGAFLRVKNFFCLHTVKIGCQYVKEYNQNVKTFLHLLRLCLRKYFFRLDRISLDQLDLIYGHTGPALEGAVRFGFQ